MPPARIADAADPRVIEEAARIIRKGGLVAFPTETVYGLGADALNARAVARVFEVKARPRLDPLIIHVENLEGAERYGRIPKIAQTLATEFWPGPLTLIVLKHPAVPDIVTAGLDTVAVRVPAHPAALALIHETGSGIAAPSANPFGYVSPTEASHVAEQLGGAIELILDGGPCSVGLESTILSLTDPSPRILRTGGTPLEELESILGKVDLQIGISDRPQAPGQLLRHYATNTPLKIMDEALEELKSGERVGLLSLLKPEDPQKYDAVEILSPSGDLREAAANLFKAMRRLDSMELDRIIARPLPEEGLGLAIMDRLRRSSVKSSQGVRNK